MHGGSAGQVQAAAKLRLAALVDPSIGVLAKLIRKSRADHLSLGAAKDVLDRAGYKPSDKLEHTGADGGPIKVAMVYRDADKAKS